MGKLLVYDCVVLNLLDVEKDVLCVECGGLYWWFKLDWDCIEWVDGIFGDILIDVLFVFDLVLIKNSGQFFYMFVLVVDDIEMEIINVVCGFDYVINIVIQIQMIEVFGGIVFVFVYYLLLIGLQGEVLLKCFGILLLWDLCENGIELMLIMLLMVCFGLFDLVELCDIV